MKNSALDYSFYIAPDATGPSSRHHEISFRENILDELAEERNPNNFSVEKKKKPKYRSKVAAKDDSVNKREKIKQGRNSIFGIPRHLPNSDTRL